MINLNLKKELFGSNNNIVLDIDLQIKKGEFICLTGESGSGKTTFLRLIAGLEEAQEAYIKVEDKQWINTNNKKEFVKTKDRKIGYLFQDFALFPNMSVLENLLFVKKDLNFALKLLLMVGLEKSKDRMPNRLSGGQKQRVALCRALMNKPTILLLDEPLSSLDLTMRQKLQKDIMKFHKEFKITTIMVSHDPSEIYKLSTRVLLLKDGNIIKDGSAKEVLLKTQGSQKFSFEGEILEIYKADILDIAVVSISNQIVEVVLNSQQAQDLKVTDKITLSTKAFSPSVKKI